MKVIHKHNIYLDKRQSNIYIDVMQADANTRVLELSLYASGKAWNVPEGVSVAIAYSGASGHGAYDTLQDGTVAYSVDGNVVTAVVTPQAIAMPGNTDLTIVFTDGNGKQLSSFCVTLKVERNPAVNATKPPDYINLRQWLTKELADMVTGSTTVTITQEGNILTADKSFKELYVAHVAGQTVVCKLPDCSVLALAVADENGLLFQGENGRDYQQIIIGADGTITYKSGKYALLGELVTDATIGVYPSGDGYESTDTLEDLQESAKAGRTIVCNLEVGDGELLRLPMTKREDDAFHFSAVFDGKEYLVTINADGATVEISECGGGNSGGNVDLTGVVKSVNGKTPDENGNVNVIGGEAPENVALLEDVTMDEASGDFIPMLSENGTEYRLSIGNDGIPVIKNLDGRVVWNGTSGGSSGGDTGGDTGGDSGDDNDDPIDNTEWVSGAEIAYTVIADEYPDKNDGSIKSDAGGGGYDRTDYIYCYGAYLLWSTGGSAYNAWYDSAKQFISSFSTSYEGYQKVPENAVYMVCSAATLDNFKCKLYKKVEPTWSDGVAYQFTLIDNESVGSGGVDKSDSGWKRTDFLNCAGASKLVRTDGGGDVRWAFFYNAEKEYIMQFTYVGGATEVNVPVGACYFKVSATGAIMDALVIVPHA